jgi:L-ascorbate metabolism protein UlaG (beta-lactamase superfamily)
VIGGLSLDFIGHSCLVIDIDGVRIVTDPVLRARVGPLQRVVPVPARSRLADVDVVLISHLHWDHLDLPSLKWIAAGTPLIVPVGAGEWLRRSGFPQAQELAIGEAIDVRGIRIDGVPANHSGFRPPAGPTGQAMGFVIHGSSCVYFAGDTDLFEQMSMLPGPKVDVALIPVWGWGPTLGRGRHLDPERAAQALQLIRPRAAVPIHWGTYWPHSMQGLVYPERLVEPPAAFVEYALEMAPRVRCLVTEIGEMVDLSGV